MSYKVIATPNDGSFTSESLEILNQIAQNLAGEVTTSLTKVGATYTFTFIVEGDTVALTGVGLTPDQAFKSLLVTALQEKIEAVLP